MRSLYIVVTCCVLALSWRGTALAAAPAAYSTSAGYTVTPPYDSHSFTTLLAAFPASSTRLVDGYPLASRLLAATGHTVYLLKTFGESDWLPVATLAASDPYMDPAFLALTPDGEKIALGTGLDKPLYVFPTSALSVTSPVVLTTSPQARLYPGLNYYSAAFRDDRYLFVNAGGAELGESYVYVIDTEATSDAADASVAMNASDASDASAATPPTILANIPGASAGIAFDAAGDLVTGIGWVMDDSTTGDIKIFSAASIAAALSAGTSIDYATSGQLLATNLLSADSLGFDSAGDLDVSGGDVFGSSGDIGYADVVSSTVVTRVLAGGAPADASNPADVTEIAPDPCKNDDWTGITYVPGVDMVIVSANLATMPPNCAMVDYTDGGTPVILYFPPDAPDQNGNGIPDGADPTYETQLFFGPAQLTRLVNALDATSADANFDATVDYDGDGTIGNGDFTFLRAQWGMPLTH